MSARVRLCAALVGLVAGLLVVSPAQAEATEAQAQAQAQAPTVADAQMAADEPTAMQIAQLYQHPVGVTTETSETAQVQAEPDGSFRLTSSPVPERARLADGSWQPIDLTLQADAGMYVPAVSAVPVQFSGGGSGPLARIQATSGDWLAETWSAGALPTPTVSGASATYPDVLTGVDLRVTATAVGMSEVLIVQDAAAAANPALASLRFGIDDGALTSSANPDGSLVSKTDSGLPVLVSDAPTWWDSSSPGASADGPGGDGVPAPVAHTDTPTGITVDASAVVAQPDLHYPLYVDPPTAWTGSQVSYTFVDSAYSTTSYWNGSGASDAYAHVGYIDGAHSDDGLAHTTRSYFSLDTSWLAGKYINSAYFDATEVYSSSCTASDVELWTAGATNSSTTWSNQPGWSDHIATTSMAHGYSSSCPATAVGWDVTAAVQRAADAGSSAINMGMKAPAPENNWLSWKKFRNDPYLDVRYYDYPSQPAWRAVSGCYAVCGLPTLTHLAEPLLSARSTGDAGNTLYYKFEVYQGHSATPTTLVASGNTADHALGETAQWGVNVPLQNNGDYEYHAVACYGGTQVCGKVWSGYFTFTIDTTAPPAPTLTAVNNDFQFFNGPPGTPPASRTGNEGTPGAVVIGANNNPDHDDYQYVYAPQSGLSVSATSATPCQTVTGDVISVCQGLDANGNVTVNLTPQEMTDTLTLVAIDKAGNVSTGDALGNANNSDTYSYFVNGTLAWQAKHGWVEATGGTDSSVADVPQAGSSALPLTLGTGVSWGTVDNDNPGPYPGHPFNSYLAFPAAGGAAATTAAAPDVQADAANSLTAAIWALPAARQSGDLGYHTAFSQDGIANSAFYIQRTPDDHWRGCMPEMQAGGTKIDCTPESLAPIDTADWTLLTLVWDAPAQNLTLYIGDSSTSVSMSHTTIAAASTGPVVVGRALTSHSQTDWWTGDLADPLLYNAALGTDQINALTANLPTAIWSNQ